MKKAYVVFGANTEVLEPLIEQGAAPLFVFDDNKDSACDTPCRSWKAGFDWIRNSPQTMFWVVCGVCSTPAKRRAAVEQIEGALQGFPTWLWYTVRSNAAKISRFSVMAPGAMVLDNAYVAPDCAILEHAVLLPGANLYHGSTVGRYSILVGGSIVLGRSQIGEETWVCGHATVLPDARIAAGQTIGAGSTVKQLGGQA